MARLVRRSTPLAIALALASAPLGAVELSPGGLGQVLLYPYYSVAGSLQTVISVTNTAGDAKALRVVFREGRNGRTVSLFNLYLGAHDVWTGVVLEAPLAGGEAGLLPLDSSCTAPQIVDHPLLPVVGESGAHYTPFRNFIYTGTHDDAGSASLARTREGTFEIIEMGTLAQGSPSAAAANSPGTATPNCAPLQNAWLTGGYWIANPTQDLRNPTGGLFGTALLVDVANGAAFQMPATALDHFRDSRAPGIDNQSRTMHLNPLEDGLDLSDAVTTTGANATAVASIGGKNYVYPAARAIDAVTAVLAAASVANELVTSQDILGTTDWVVSWPTKRYYTDPEIVGGSAIAPFARRFDANNADGCEAVRFTPFDRSQSTPGCGGQGQAACVVDLCGTVSVLALDHEGPGSGSLGSETAVNRDLPFDAGFGVLDWRGPEVGVRRLRPDADGRVLEGLPVIGFSAFGAVNANAQPGIMANYTTVLPHRTTPGACVDGPCN